MKWGTQNSFRYSFGAILLSIAGVVLVASPLLCVIFALLFALSFTVLSVSSLPLAIDEANYYEKVFCVGIFFSGVELFDGVVDIVMNFV